LRPERNGTSRAVDPSRTVRRAAADGDPGASPRQRVDSGSRGAILRFAIYRGWNHDRMAMNPHVPELGRFAEPALLILVSLSDGPKHGYAIMTDVEAGTGRPLGPGTLYAALARLEERGLIEALPPVDRRRPYRLTAIGASLLAEQLQQLTEFARVGLRRLGQADVA
jgi:DNA-binding PadR family transcriptional regulator